MAQHRRKLIVVDFDGVIHGYNSGWKGATVITDPPVPGALEFLVRALEYFDVAILSSRSHQWGGRRAMKRYIREQLIKLGAVDVAAWWSTYIRRNMTSYEPWDVLVREAADLVVRSIRWPLFKPPAHVTIDDRAITFGGIFPELEKLGAFKPWNNRGPNPAPFESLQAGPETLEALKEVRRQQESTQQRMGINEAVSSGVPHSVRAASSRPWGGDNRRRDQWPNAPRRRMADYAQASAYPPINVTRVAIHNHEDSSAVSFVEGALTVGFAVAVAEELRMPSSLGSDTSSTDTDSSSISPGEGSFGGAGAGSSFDVDTGSSGDTGSGSNGTD